MVNSLRSEVGLVDLLQNSTFGLVFGLQYSTLGWVVGLQTKKATVNIPV